MAGELIQTPCGEWVIAADTNLTPKALAAGSIVIETEMRDLPAVRRLDPGDVVLDVGAYVGDTALIFLSLGCEVHAFEAYPDAFECLTRNCPAAHCHFGPVGDGRPVSASGRFGNDTGNCAMRMVEPGGEPSLRIDTLNLPRVDFVKIDVEGFEPAVLDGMAKTITRCRPVLLVEVFDDMLKQQGFSEVELLAKLEGQGYALSRVGERGIGKYDVLGTPR